MSDLGGSNSGPLLEGISALVLAVTGGVATVVGLLRSGRKTPAADGSVDSEPDKRLADVLLDMHARDLQSQDVDYKRVVKRNHQLEDLLTQHGIPLPLWRDDDDD